MLFTISSVFFWISLGWTPKALVFSIVWFAWGLIFVFFTNYAFPNKVWTYRFRQINNQEHSGPILEGSMLFLFVLLAFVAGGLFYPVSSQEIFLKYVLSWPGGVVAAVLFAAVTYTCISVTPQSLDEEFKTLDSTGNRLITQHNPKFSELSEHEWTQELEIVRTRTERAYLFLCFMLGASLLLGIVFLIGGLKGDIETWSVDRERLRSTTHQLTEWTAKPGSILVPEVIRDAELMTPSYTILVDHTVPAYEKYLGIIAIFFAIGYWFVGTGYQKVYTESVANIMKGFALIVLFVVLPVVLVTGYALLVAAANDVTHAMTTVLEHGIEEVRGNGHLSGSTPNTLNTGMDFSAQAVIEASWLRDYGDVRSRFDEQVLATGFFTRMATSWGGAWMLLWFVVSLVVKKKQNVLILLLPALFSRKKKFFSALFLVDVAASSVAPNGDNESGVQETSISTEIELQQAPPMPK